MEEAANDCWSQSGMSDTRDSRGLGPQPWFLSPYMLAWAFPLSGGKKEDNRELWKADKSSAFMGQNEDSKARLDRTTLSSMYSGVAG